MVELLAPVGSFEKLKAAIYSGADAVYFGFKKFNARKKAQNFNLEEILDVVNFCHNLGVKAYVALNTIVNDIEIEEVKRIIYKLQEMRVDGLIVQDLGIVNIIKKVAPELKMHASTQMSVHSVAGVKILSELGFSRVVVARELTLEEIAEVCKENIEIEVFVHGALCYSLSGQCFMSSMIGGRSANRGECAQPCRLPFSLKKPPRPDISLKDLCAIDVLDRLKEVGVKSFKIEGRMKRPEYVAATTYAYRQAIDGYSFDKQELLSVFSRGGVTNGYIKNKIGKNMFGVRREEDVATKELYSKIKGNYRRPLQRFNVDVKIFVEKGKPICLRVEDEIGLVEVFGNIPEEAKTIGLSEDRVRECFEKLGGTIYKLRGIEAHIDSGVYVSKSYLNEIKKMAVLKLSRERVKKGDEDDRVGSCDRKWSGFRKEGSKKYNGRGRLRLRAECERFEQIVCWDDFEIISIDIDELYKNCWRIGSLVNRVGILMPQSMFGREQELIYKINFLKGLGIKHATVQNLGQVLLLKDFVLHGGFSLNIANSEGVELLENIGFTDIIVSVECGIETIARINKKISLGVMAAGRLPLMISRNYLADRDCERRRNGEMLVDRKGKLFPIRYEKGCCKIYNSDVLWMADRQDELRNVDFGVLKFTVEDEKEVRETVRMFIQKVKLQSGYTRGRYYKGI